MQSTVQPARIIEETPNAHSNNVVQHLSKDFYKAINEVFRLLPEELCLKPLEDHTPSKPLSGIEQLMESHPTSLRVLPQ